MKPQVQKDRTQCGLAQRYMFYGNALGLKARHITARGEAPGKVPQKTQALQGRTTGGCSPHSFNGGGNLGEGGPVLHSFSKGGRVAGKREPPDPAERINLVGAPIP